jgi:hypothetical protein
MNKQLKTELTLSLLFHLSTIGSAVYLSPSLQLQIAKMTGNEKGHGQGNEQDFDRFFNPGPIQIEIQEVAKKTTPKDEKGIDVLAKKAKPELEVLSPPSEACDDNSSFGGIGASYVSDVNDPLMSIAVSVPEYYPAFKAGIRPGDKVLTESIIGLRGKIGTTASVSFLRGNSWNVISVTRVKICFKKLAKVNL